MILDSNSGPSPETIVSEWTWKTPAMREMTLAVCRLALARGIQGEFSALDLPTHGADAHGGAGIAGTVFRQLKDAGIIGRVGVFVDGSFYARNVTNANGNPVGIYRLAHAGMARALVERHAPGTLPRPRQLEFTQGNMP